MLPPGGRQFLFFLILYFYGNKKCIRKSMMNDGISYLKYDE